MNDHDADDSDALQLPTLAAFRAALAARRGAHDVRRAVLRGVVAGATRVAKPQLAVRPRTDDEVAYGRSVDNKHPGAVAMVLAREVLSQYMLPPYDVHYAGIDRRKGAGAYGTTEGRVDVEVLLRPPTDIREPLTLPFRVVNGRMLEPSVLVYRGQPRVITQNTFDDILGRGNVFKRQLPNRSSMFGVPSRHDAPMPTVPITRPGLFGYSEVRRGAMQRQAGWPSRDALEQCVADFKAAVADAAPDAGAHAWDRLGERCARCGAKDWMGVYPCPGEPDDRYSIRVG